MSATRRPVPTASAPLPLVVIGDSLSQGVISASTAPSPTSAYAVWLARALGLEVPTDPGRAGEAGTFGPLPGWPAGGLPVDLEAIFHRLEPIARRPAGPTTWWAALRTITEVLEEAEAWYQTGPGAPDSETAGARAPPFSPVLASFGMEMAHAWQLTSAQCRARIAEGAGMAEGILTGPSAPFHRGVLGMLNPALDPGLDDHTAVTWLARHAEERGVERIIVWLGSNNAVGSLSRLSLHLTPGEAAETPILALDDQARAEAGWTLWDPRDFEADARVLFAHLDRALARNRAADPRVYIGTLPHATGAALLRGLGAWEEIDGAWYPEALTWFPQGRRFVEDGGPHLTRDEAVTLDHHVDAYNRILAALVEESNQGSARPRWVLVDTGALLDSANWGRNGGRPLVVLPPALKALTGPLDGRFFHPPRWSGGPRRGGLVSLDGLHPTAIGYGLVADVFLQAMISADQAPTGAAIDWPAVVAADALWARPPGSLHLLRCSRPVSALLLRTTYALFDVAAQARAFDPVALLSGLPALPALSGLRQRAAAGV